MEPELKVNDLFEDLKDGLKVIKLLEFLTGEKIVSDIQKNLSIIYVYI